MGHALVAHYLEHTDPVHKISVISRGQALGYTISLPQEDRYMTSAPELRDRMTAALGGRAAEELIFREVTSGASDDLERVTTIAKQMVTRYGMSEKLGPRVFGHDHSQPFLGREMAAEPDYSDGVAREIDAEIRAVVEDAHRRAHAVLGAHRAELDRLAGELLARETLGREDFLALLDGAAAAS
jgi:cell division protease FtsH